MTTLADIWHNFADIEDRESLVDWRVAGIALWPLIKNRLMRHISETAGVIEPTDPQPSVFDIPNPVDADAHRRIVGPASVVIMPFLRRTADGIDPFSHDIAAEYVRRGESVVTFAVGASDDGTGRPSLERLIRDYTARYRRRSQVIVASRMLGDRSADAKWARVIAHIETIPGANAGPYRRFPLWLLVEFTSQRHGFQRLFRQLGTRVLVMVNAHRNAVIAGAQAAGVWVVEPQHGVVSSTSAVLTWRGHDSVPYQPNEFLAWGQYWIDSVGFAGNVRGTVIGSPAAVAATRQSTEPRDPTTVVIVSQPEQTRAIADFAVKIAREFPRLNIVVRPHPKELSYALPINSPTNVRLDSGDRSLISRMASAGIVIGVYSTALFEGYALGCRVGILDLPGREHVGALLGLPGVSLITDTADLHELHEATVDRIQAAAASEYFYAPVPAVPPLP